MQKHEFTFRIHASIIQDVPLVTRYVREAINEYCQQRGIEGVQNIKLRFYEGKFESAIVAITLYTDNTKQ